MPSPTAPARRVAEQHYHERGLATLPPSRPLAKYVPAVEFGGLVFMSGNGPLDPAGSPVVVGRLGDDVGVDAGIHAAELATSNLLTSLRAALGSLDRVASVCEVRGYLRCAPGFERQDDVMAGASQLLIDMFGPEVGTHVPTVVSVSECVLGLTVTIDAIFSVDTGTGVPDQSEG
jgi:enamine deaminase RidA (YjgF/YER057c/UK114 family)